VGMENSSSEKLEIERKFLLKCLPDTLCDREETVNIHQLYVTYKSENFRIREINWERNRRFPCPQYVLTRKTEIKPGVAREYEEDISYKRFCKYKNHATKELKKRRFKINQKNLIWEIDNYESPIKLIIAEIELPEENYPLIIPDFIQKSLIMEVTEFSEFKNYNLAMPVIKE